MKRSEPPKKEYFLTVAWRTQGIVIGVGRPSEFGSLWGTWINANGRERYFYGRIGSSVFETHEAAADSVKKKAAAAAKRMRKELARIEAIADGAVAP